MTGKLVVKQLKSSNRYTSSQLVSAQTNPISQCSIKQRLRSNHDALALTFSETLIHRNTFIKKNKKLASYNKGKQSLLIARSQVKGTNSAAQVYQNSLRLYSPQSKVYHCDFFRLLYFPPDHFLSIFRKSKPGLNVRTVGEVFLNGNISGDGLKQAENVRVFKENSKIDKYGKKKDVSKLTDLQSFFKNNGSNTPKNYAYLRRYLRMFVHKRFIKEWEKLNGDKAVFEQIEHSKILDQLAGAGLQPRNSVHNNTSTLGKDAIRDFLSSCEYLDARGRSKQGVAKDGFYLYQVLIFPDAETRREFASNIQRSVQVVANLEWNGFLKGKSKNKTWVEEINDKVRPPAINLLLRNDQTPWVVTKE